MMNGQIIYQTKFYILFDTITEVVNCDVLAEKKKNVTEL
jgi:hypothetical protein